MEESKKENVEHKDGKENSKVKLELVEEEEKQ